jgi:hypothetical protein
VHRDHDGGRADLILRWKGGAIAELSVPLKRKPPQRLRTGEDTIDLLRRAGRPLPRRRHRRDPQPATPSHRPGPVVHRRQGPVTAPPPQDPCHQPGNAPTEGEPLTVADAAHQLGLAPSTLHRWLNEGFIAGEQLTPGAPWHSRLTDDLSQS